MAEPWLPMVVPHKAWGCGGPPPGLILGPGSIYALGLGGRGGPGVSWSFPRVCEGRPRGSPALTSSPSPGQSQETRPSSPPHPPRAADLLLLPERSGLRK